MTVGRLNYLKKLFQYLKQNQSEDCLYLNIYAPERKTGGAAGRMETADPCCDTSGVFRFII
jgi:hypothetical protein